MIALAYRFVSIGCSVLSIVAGAHDRLDWSVLLIVGALVLLLAGEIAYPSEGFSSRRDYERRKR